MNYRFSERSLGGYRLIIPEDFPLLRGKREKMF